MFRFRGHRWIIEGLTEEVDIIRKGKGSGARKRIGKDNMFDLTSKIKFFFFFQDKICGKDFFSGEIDFRLKDDKFYKGGIHPDKQGNDSEGKFYNLSSQ